MPKYRVLPSLHSDLNEGRVWVGIENLGRRPVIKIHNYANGCTVWCEALSIDRNFVASYSQGDRELITDPSRTLVLSGWYRQILGITESRSDETLELTVERSAIGRAIGQVRAAVAHPQNIVRLGIYLGLAGVVLSLVGFVLGVLSILLALFQWK